MQVILDSNIKATKQPIHGFNIGIGYTIDLSLVESGSRTYQHCFRENGVEPVTIDWGDGTVETLIPQSLENSPTHTYKQEDGDRFDIKITGESIPLSFSFYASTDTKQAVVDIWCLNYHVSNLNGCASMFSGYENLEHVDSRWFEINRMSAVNDGYCLFKDTKVTDIPDEIFQHASSTNYQSTFENTKINTPPHIPNHATYLYRTFKNTRITRFPSQLPPNATNIYECFMDCTEAVGEMPEFPHPTGNVTLNGVYRNCPGLTGTIKSFPKTTSLSCAFYGCTNLEGPIPEFPTNCTNLYYAFNSCFNLQGGIPNFPSYVTSMTGTFLDCQKLVGPLPASFPQGVTDFRNAFNRCYELTGQIPPIPDTVLADYLVGAFNRCYKLTGPFPAIPSTYTGSLYALFGNCHLLSGPLPSIPDGVTSLEYFATGCYEATALPSYIPSSITNVGWAFDGCSKITGTAPELWNRELYPNIPIPTTRNYCFRGCTGLSNYSEIPALWK